MFWGRWPGGLESKLHDDRCLVLATRNKGKADEIRVILNLPGLKLSLASDFPGAPEVEEKASTYAENAAAKARTLAAYSGHYSLADDSGLEVDLLGGQPGVFSARFSGVHRDDQENIRKLLRLLDGVPFHERTARFRCVVALAGPGGELVVKEGTCEGIITESPRGSSGFGYDPVFLVPEFGKTFAELGPGIKNKISHRARALNAIRFDIMAALGYNIHCMNSGA
ncbi:MAG: XTP/dITP diphosphatase [Firmicutes bacterium]|nr:XTP/dITP diphosphatase [Bacillota bacterium]